MPRTRVEHVRVVIQFDAKTRPDLTDGNNNKALKTTLDEVQILDATTLRLIVNESVSDQHIQITYNMRFDCIGLAADDNLADKEIENVMKNMFLNKQNSCLVRFTARTECNLSFLHKVLVTIVNRNLLKFKLDLQYIRVSYYDIRNTNVVDMLQNVLKRQQPAAVSIKCTETQMSQQKRRFSFGTINDFVMLEQLLSSESRRLSCNAADHSFINNNKGTIIKQEFRSTWILLSWLLNNYRSTFASGHEALEIEFTVKRKADDGELTTPYTVTLTLLLVSFYKMDGAARDHITEYFRSSCSSYKHTPLTSVLSQYMDPINNVRTMLLYEVPLNVCQVNDCGVEMLLCAHTVINWRNSTLQRTINANQEASVSADCSMLAATTTTTAMMYEQPNFRQLSEFIVSYKQIDDKFDAACRNLRNHYRTFYGAKIMQTCAEIQLNPRTMLYERDVESIPVANPVKYYNDFHNAMTDFMQLPKEFEHFSKHRDVLQTYYLVKKYHLEKLDCQLRQEQLDLWRVKFMKLINDEYHKLKSQLSALL